ncbi:carbohydrate sulfotransferase 6-like [Pelobates cultripes]|uniref:Sulfotransferase n=1 Tax=Pelobates cultripes TaxID=61616 RepID=A0AAD1T0S2_PELCU|nr:carbohydrate sulfotransferase 6-like [Pelobates cultripes]
MHSQYLQFAFFLFLSLVVLILLQSFQLNFHSSTNPYPYQKRPVHVLIISSWRSGSSFIGQIFNHHDDVFYLFEPAHPIWMRLNQESAELLHYPVRDLLRSLFFCDVTPLYSYLPSGGQRISEMKFFAESRALCSTPFCQASIPLEGYDRNLCFHRCKNISLGKMEETCRSYSHVVMKTVRIFDLKVLLPLLQDPSLDLRILHLVRDPRAVTASRKYFSLNIDDQIVVGNEKKKKDKNDKLTLAQVMTKICNAQVTINKAAIAAGESLHGRYMLLRYEDLAVEPFLNVKRIYKFVGLSISPNLEKWIYNVTHNDSQSKKGFMPYSRDAISVTQKWRKVLKFASVKEIEHVCSEEMKQFGYLPLKSPRHLGNLKVNLVARRKIEGEEE